MNKVFLLAVPIAFCILLSACATTGDPTRGGLFGWSEGKAKERQTEARRALEQEERREDALRLERQKLESQIAAKKRELAALQKSIDPSSGPNAAEAERIKRLEQEIDDLSEEALTLMDM